MNLDEYQRLAARTLNSDLPHEMQMTVYGLGLTGEATEVLDLFFDDQPEKAAVVKEVGDVAWYGAALCTRQELSLDLALHVGYTCHLDVNPEDWTNGELAQALVINAGQVGELLKKAFGHMHPLDSAYLTTLIGRVLWCAAQLLSRFDATLEEALERNIAKLRQRYPEGFSVEASIARVDTVGDGTGQHVEKLGDIRPWLGITKPTLTDALPPGDPRKGQVF